MPRAGSPSPRGSRVSFVSTASESRDHIRQSTAGYGTIKSNIRQEASMMESHCLSRVHLFRDLPEEQLTSLVGHCERMLFEPGDVIFKKGDSADWLYIVESGAVEIVIPSEGEDIVLATFSPGSFFGELGVF